MDGPRSWPSSLSWPQQLLETDNDLNLNDVEKDLYWEIYTFLMEMNWMQFNEGPFCGLIKPISFGFSILNSLFSKCRQYQGISGHVIIQMTIDRNRTKLRQKFVVEAYWFLIFHLFYIECPTPPFALPPFIIPPSLEWHPTFDIN